MSKTNLPYFRLFILQAVEFAVVTHAVYVLHGCKVDEVLFIMVYMKKWMDDISVSVTVGTIHLGY